MLALASCIVPEMPGTLKEIAPIHTVNWSYADDTGPDYWSGLSPQFAPCGNGDSQSPINLSVGTEVLPHDLEFQYSSSPLEIINSGRTLHIDYAPGSKIFTGGKQYELQQIHFHHLSEHTFYGLPAAMEMHLAHRDEAGNIAAVSVLLEAGPKSDLLQRMWGNLPTEAGQKQIVEGGEANIVDLLSAERSYFSYSGSLTTPPCSENVNWFVFRTPMTIAEEQIAQAAELFPANARPTQKLNDRTVFFSQRDN